MIRFNAYSLTLGLFSIILLSSCQKLMDFFPTQSPPGYRIKSITYGTNANGSGTATFYYNKWNNPDSVIFTRVGTGQPNFLFYYNKKKQIREIKESYMNGQYEKWHRLGLNNKGQIIVDTIYIFGYLNLDPEPANFWSKRIEKFEYDSYGRITKITDESVVPVSPSSSHTITYGADGNLIEPYVTPEYDNYRNPLTLHPLWQFIQKNYSLNNPMAAVSYNSYRLPLQFNYVFSRSDGRFPFFSGRNIDQAYISYEMK